MYTVINGQHVMKFESKEDMIRYFVNQEPFFVLKRDLKEYVPSVFREVAMNPHDCRTVVDWGGTFLPWLRGQEKAQRAVMVYDGNNRVIDIRLWLPEFRAAAEERINNANKYVWFGCSGAKPKFRKGYRVVTGFKQQMSLHEQVDREEIVQAMGLVPVKLLRKHTPDADIGMRCDCRSWKEQSKCRKSWQRRSGQPSARKLHEDEWAKYLEEQAYSVEEEDADLLQAG